VFAGFVHADVLEEGHRRLFLERYPPNALVFADPRDRVGRESPGGAV
jgi:hypothetical protein